MEVNSVQWTFLRAFYVPGILLGLGTHNETCFLPLGNLKWLLRGPWHTLNCLTSWFSSASGPWQWQSCRCWPIPYIPSVYWLCLANDETGERFQVHFWPLYPDPNIILKLKTNFNFMFIQSEDCVRIKYDPFCYLTQFDSNDLEI